MQSYQSMKHQNRAFLIRNSHPPWPADRSKWFQIRVGDTRPSNTRRPHATGNALCYHDMSGLQENSWTYNRYTCYATDGLWGRYVSIQRLYEDGSGGDRFLCLSEVQVYGPEPGSVTRTNPPADPPAPAAGLLPMASGRHAVMAAAVTSVTNLPCSSNASVNCAAGNFIATEAVRSKARYVVAALCMGVGGYGCDHCLHRMSIMVLSR